MRFVILLLLSCGFLQAHQIAEMSLFLNVHGDVVTGHIEADAAYMLDEFRGDDDEEPKDLAWLRQLGRDGWEKIERESESYLRECLIFRADGAILDWQFDIPVLDEARPRFLDEGIPEEMPFLDIAISVRIPETARKLEADWKEPFGVVLIVTTGEETEAETIPIVSGSTAVLAEREGSEPALTPKDASASYWIGLGFIHILPRGVDHILFVIGLFLLIPKWKPLLQQTVTFTVAHSISLGAAILGWVTFPERPVEIMIAASIAWIGIENLWMKQLGKYRLLLVGAFGLIHGLGFASVLKELLPASRPDELPLALLGFNIGVECGQIVVLLFAFACFGWIKEKKFQRVKLTGSIIVALAGLTMVIERLADVELVPFI